MDHLDLDGIFSTTASNWMLPAFEQQDGNFLSASRQMLEPIMEETSEDEENQTWSQYENVWSSESDTGSVIRIELHNDQDSISERDYACPAKRPRRDDLINLEETTQFRKYQRNDFLTADNQDNFRKRFDEFYSDSDSLSYNSLSRSSSLIQFESLERQLQGDHTSLGNSSPSLLSFDASNDNKGSNGCLRRYESSESRLHQTYFDLDKIDFENTLIFTDQCNHHSKSDSESSDNSILSHEERILKPSSTGNSSDHRNCYKGKSSAENLSEDSGYCEHVTALRIKSKSIPNFIRKSDKFCEEDEFEIHKSLEAIFDSSTIGSSKSGREKDREILLHSRSENTDRMCCEKQSFPIENKRNFKTKIDPRRSAAIVEQNDEKQRRVWYNGQEDDVKNKIHPNTIASSSSRLASPSSSSSSPSSSFSSTLTTNRATPLFVSSSLPDVRIQFDHDRPIVANSSSDLNCERFDKYDKGQFTTVSSVPNDLNLLINDSNCYSDDHYGDDHDNYSWNLREKSSVRSENRQNSSFSYGWSSQSAKSLNKPVQNHINASYNNLTLLDYSGRSRSNRNSLTMSDCGGNSKRNSREFELGKGNFLLDEISMHFDKNLSILSDREPDSDLVSRFLDEEKQNERNVPPKPPSRRSNSHKEQRVTPPIPKPPRKITAKIVDITFDQDPTIMRTSYAESLEKCNFDPKELSNSDLRNFATHSTPIKRGFVASTPNLNSFRDRDDQIDDELYVSSAHTSMNPLPEEKKLGILLPGGSRNSLGKGVSFCPVVSEISWQEQSSEECMDPDSLENICNQTTIMPEERKQEHNDEVDTCTTVEPVAAIITSSTNSNQATCVQKDHEQNNNRSKQAAISNVPIVLVSSVFVDSENKTEPLTSENSSLSCNRNCDGHNQNAVMEKGGAEVSDSINNNNKMSSVSVKSATIPLSCANTGTELLNAKFKPKPDEKHHKSGFLSRFAGGFRFSLRRKKKPSNEVISNETFAKCKPKKSIADGAIKSSGNSTSASQKSPDFIYIPLKGPIVKQIEPPCNVEHTERHLSSPGAINGDNNHVLLGKPPLPKQPPRVVGVCEKVRASPQYLHHYGGGNQKHAPGQRSSSQPREIDERFLDNEKQYYSNSNQLNGTMNGNGCSNSAPPLSSRSTKSPSRCPPNIVPSVGPNGNCKIGLIETNLDTHETVISGKTRSLMELGPQVRHTLSKQSACNDASDTAIDGTSRRPHKSMEFLLDKENQKNVLPPENELQKSHDSTAALSEHQLRVQASLQRLNIPDWFRQYSSTPKSTEPGYKPGNFTRKRASDSGRWTGLNSKTTSLSSLGSQRSDRSPLLLSPSAHSHHGGQVGFSRWSTSYLNSTQTSPSVSTRGSFSRGGPANSSFISVGGTSIRNSYRQPYLGWRSQEKLSQPRTPHERLASSLLSQKPPKPEPAVTPEIQSSIKEVTSAIVHYVNDQTNRAPRSRSTSPSSRKCWLESSFVGIRPVESPQTPIIENSFNTNTNTTTTTATSSMHSGITSTSDALRMNGVDANNQSHNVILNSSNEDNSKMCL